MAAIASITITDGTTPVTFSPVAVSPLAQYLDISSASVPEIGRPKIQLQVMKGKGKASNRTRVSLEFPVMEVVDGGTTAGFQAAPAVAYSVTAVLDVWSPQRSTKAQRQALRQYFTALLSNGQVVDAVDDMVPPL